MEIRIEHAARGETLDHAQFLNSKQNQRRPDVIKKLNGYKQNPERNLVFLTLSCKSNAVMSNKHLTSKPVIFCSAFDWFAPANSVYQLACLSLAAPRLHSVNSEGFR